MAEQDKIPVEIDITSRHDPRGVNDAKAGFAGIEKGISAASQRAEMFGKVLRGLGYFALIQQGISIFNSLRERINASREAAEKLADQQADARARQALEEQKVAYDALKSAIMAVNAELARRAELEALLKGGERGKEDAQSRLDEQAAVALIAADDPERKEKEDAVRARFARQRAIAEASRQKEDAILERQRLAASAEAKDSAAAGVDAQADETGRLIDAQRAQQRYWQDASQKSKSWGSFYDRIRYHRPDEKPMVDTAESKAAAAKAEAAAKRADELEKLLADQRKTAAALRIEAGHARSKDSAAFASIEAADTSVKAADMEGGRATRSADAAVVKARADREAKAKAEAAAIATREREAAEKRALAASGREDLRKLEDTERRERVEADRSAYDFSRLPKRQRAGAEEGMRREQEQAREAARALGAARPEIVSMIGKLLDDAKRLEAEVKQLRNRQNNARADAGNID